MPECAWSDVKPRLLHDERRLDEDRPFLTHIGPNKYAIPWKYLLARPPRDAPSCAYRKEGVAVQFLLPDGGSISAESAVLPDSDVGGGQSRQGDNAGMIIRVFTSEYAVADPSPSVNPQRGFNNVVKNYRIHEVSRYKDLLAVEYNHGIPGQKGFFHSEEKYDIFFSCVFVEHCKASLFLKKEKLAFGMLVQSQSVEHHATIAGLIDKLFSEWEIDSK